ncbi:hypothetical protein [Bradyrhizobium sp. CCGUVB23]|uniref:hypothetical protein n=1 Tax=Bradyrhizobium sp. CCGUVB23 TaxID=2949630 RepID=UPI0020B1DD20|nr:hypothetical protein [Bradyrhizobium sp. CCGUVB23]MCP3468316.1 hypothetical protein [Bradyrhizobium sp. CCGUVB23]
MDRDNFNLFGFDPNAYYAMVAQQEERQAEQPEQAAQGNFEQHLEEAAQPGAPDDGRRYRRYRATPEDEDLIERAGHAARTAPNRTISEPTLVHNRSGLRMLSERLHDLHGLSLSRLDDESLKIYAEQLFPGEAKIRKGLSMLRLYRGTPGTRVTPEDADLIERAGNAARERRSTSIMRRIRGGLATSSIQQHSSGLRKLSERLRDNYNLSLAALSDDTLKDYAETLCPGDVHVRGGLRMLKQYRETLGEGTSGAAEGSASQPVQQPSLSPVHESPPSPVHESSPSRVSSYNQDELWEAADTVPLRGASPAASYNSAEFWAGVDQRGQVPAESWGNTSSFWRGMEAPSPAPSVNQPSPSWEQGAEASIFGAPYMPPAQPAAPDLTMYVPAWQHGDQRAPEHLMRGMHYMGVLPNNDDRQQTNFTIGGVPYTATLGPSRKQNDIRVFLARRT